MSYRNQPRDRRGRWTTTGGGVIATLAATLLISTGGGVGAVDAAGAGSSARSGSSSSSQARARDRDAGRVAVRLQRLGERVDQVTSAADTDCAAHATGEVRAFFRENPCAALFRVLFDVRDAGRPVLRVAVAVVVISQAEPVGRAGAVRDLAERAVEAAASG